jgi:hypothetical protein
VSKAESLRVGGGGGGAAWHGGLPLLGLRQIPKRQAARARLVEVAAAAAPSGVGPAVSGGVLSASAAGNRVTRTRGQRALKMASSHQDGSARHQDGSARHQDCTARYE